MQLTQSSVGRKIIMAVTGIVLVGFVCVHLLGNSSMFVGADAINAYAQKLHSLGPFVWVFRLVMLVAFALHIAFGIQLTLENKAATPEANVQVKRLKTGFGAETMIVSGLVMLAFVIYHLLQFTVQVPGMGVYEMNEATQMVNVYTMVVAGFKSVLPVIIYLAGMFFLFLHVSHGFQSLFQTLGLCNDKSLPVTGMVSKLVGFVLLLGYIAIPLSIVFGYIKL